MAHYTRRTAVGLGAAGALVLGASAASALPAKPGPALPPGASVKPRTRTTPAPPATSPVPVTEQGLALELTWGQMATRTLSDMERTQDLTLRSVPSRLTLANRGTTVVPAGTAVRIKTAVLDGAGLLTGRRQPVLATGASNNVRSWLTITQQADASLLTLSQNLPAGTQLAVDVTWQLAGGLKKAETPQVQLRATAVLLSATTGYYEAQSREVLLTRP